MGEYFDVSLIIKRTEGSFEKMTDCLFSKFKLLEGENKIESFKDKIILMTCYKNEEMNFDEICLGFSNQTFHKDEFKNEINIFTSFLQICFECNSALQYALCSYELNGYLIGEVKSLEDFNDKLLRKFPVVYQRNEGQINPDLILNLKAQNLW